MADRRVAPVVVADGFFQKPCEVGILLAQRIAAADVVVIVIVDAIRAKPRLNSFGPILGVKCPCVFSLPQAGLLRRLKSGFQSLIKRRIDVH